MHSFKAIFEAYGANYAATMPRFVGKEALYMRFLTMFFADDSYETLGSMLAAQDWKAAFEAAHTLKGVAGNMGLTPLYDVVCTLLELLRAGGRQEDAAHYDALYAEIGREMERVRALDEALKGAAHSDE